MRGTATASDVASCSCTRIPLACSSCVGPPGHAGVGSATAEHTGWRRTLISDTGAPRLLLMQVGKGLEIVMKKSTNDQDKAPQIQSLDSFVKGAALLLSLLQLQPWQ